MKLYRITYRLKDDTPLEQDRISEAWAVDGAAALGAFHKRSRKGFGIDGYSVADLCEIHPANKTVVSRLAFDAPLKNPAPPAPPAPPAVTAAFPGMLQNGKPF
ncbi:hypothetical protein [Geminisphaera colitermitum]|uniref:hypothetical protein n=1 Tax=Geminisphaera colitermitum TaxID=1148786 RepID=UPI000158D0EC|nr:hypothetical protein [Geminisphaera colitermitum]